MITTHLRKWEWRQRESQPIHKAAPEQRWAHRQAPHTCLARSLGSDKPWEAHIPIKGLWGRLQAVSLVTVDLPSEKERGEAVGIMQVSPNEICSENVSPRSQLELWVLDSQGAGQGKGCWLKGRRDYFSGKRVHKVMKACLIIWLVTVQMLRSPRGNKNGKMKINKSGKMKSETCNKANKSPDDLVCA